MLQIDADRVTAQYNSHYPPLTGDNAAGLRTLLGFIANDPDLTDLRLAAYMLATVKHECANTFRPIEEFGKGENRPYGRPVTVTDSQGNSYANVYYGRGYVQLTWHANYETLDRDLRLNGVLLFHPEMALDPTTAYAIMSFGMRNGVFTGKKLSDYIHDDTCDYLNARRVINALDRAALIQGYAEAFESLLRASLVAEPSSTASVAASGG